MHCATRFGVGAKYLYSFCSRERLQFFIHLENFEWVPSHMNATYAVYKRLSLEQEILKNKKDENRSIAI
jgi:hypothetical protein